MSCSRRFLLSVSLWLPLLVAAATPPHAELLLDAPKLRSCVQQLARYHKFETLPQVKFSQLKDLEERTFVGAGTSARWVGSLHGRRVHLKVSQREWSEFLNEARWFLLLNRMGLGPKFHGVTEMPDGARALVTDYIEGIHVKAGTALPKGFQISPKVLQRIRETGRMLKQAGVRATYDMQFILTHDDAILIDPELFEFPVRHWYSFLQFLNVADDPVLSAEAFIPALLPSVVAVDNLP